ncbi:MAG: hypothetical protein KOO63_11445 [Bacteroidales bacterium]|nr:hypothetical protein [Candidatus Latescibacterota bacterium]
MKSPIYAIFLVFLLSLVFVFRSNAQSMIFSPRCSVVYRDTLFFGGQSNPKNPTSPLSAVGDGLGHPFDSPVPIPGPWRMGKERISHMAVFQGDLVVAGNFANRYQTSPENGLFKYDGFWQPFQLQPPGNPGSISDVLVSGGVLYLAGRFKDPETGITENVLAFDGHQWHKLGLHHGWQYVTRLCEFEGMVIAAAGIRSRELNEEYIRQDVLSYTISRWDGSSWISLKKSKGGMPVALSVFAENLYVGFFTLAAAGPHPSVMRFDGREWSPVGASFQTGASNGFVKVGGLGSYRDKLVAVGKFDRANGVQIPGAAYLSEDTWQPLGLEIESLPQCLATFDQNLWVGQIPRKEIPGLLFWTNEIPVDAPLKRVVEPEIHPPQRHPEVAPFRNGDFSERKDGQPVGWTYERSLMASMIKPAEDSHAKDNFDTLSFSVDGGVLVPPQPSKGLGRYLKQEFPTEEGKVYRARVRARVVYESSGGQLPARFNLSVGQSWDRLEITKDDFRWYELELPGSDRSFSGKITFSGGRSGGHLEIAEVQLTEHDLDFTMVFDAFCQDFSGQYANFEFVPVAWDSLVAHWRPIAADAQNCVAFYNIILKMLGELNDPKLILEKRASDVTSMQQTSWDPAEEARMSAIRKRAKAMYRGSPLRDGVQSRPKAEFVDVDGHQIFYLSVMAASQKLKLESVDAFLTEVARAEGILLDLRHYRSNMKKTKHEKTIIDNLPKVPTVALIDPSTRGAGADIAIALKDHTDITFVGQESGTPSQIMDELNRPGFDGDSTV